MINEQGNREEDGKLFHGKQQCDKRNKPTGGGGAALENLYRTDHYFNT